jgi:M6 family metalloprotease-like protein
MRRRFKVLVLLTLMTVAFAQSIASLGTVVYAWPPYRAVIGGQRLIVITVDFSDTMGTFSTDYVRGLILGKANAYFKEASYNQAWIDGNITRSWYELPGTSASYEWKKATPEGSWEYFQGFVRTVVRLADSEVDFSKYRYVVIVHSGKWRFSWGFVAPFKISTREGTFTVNVPIISLYHQDSVFAHELAHVFGNLPDMYDEHYTDSYVGPWDLMSRTDTRYTQHLSAWSKIKVGWIPLQAVATVPRGKETMAIIDPLELPTSGFQALKIPLTVNTYYLAEVRQKIGSDIALPDYGVVIYFVDETRNEWGQSPIVVQDSSPSTSTLDDATFDLRVGKQAGFFDRKNNVSIVITAKSGQSYTLFAGPVSQGEVTLATSEKALAATVAIDSANASIRTALLEGRTEGLENAKSLLANASRAFEKEDYDASLTLSQQAEEAADSATYPQSYYDSKDLLAKVKDLEAPASAMSFMSSEAQRLVREATSARVSAEGALVRYDFSTAKGYAQTAVSLFERAFSVEEDYRGALEAQQRQAFNYTLVGATSAIVLAVVAVHIVRKRSRRAVA